MRWTVIGLSGVTNGGKSSLARALLNTYPGTCYLCQDDYFHGEDWPFHELVKELNHHNYEIMSALDMDKMVSDVQQIIDREPGEDESGLLILDGFLLLVHDYLRSLCSLKFYVDLDYEGVKARRATRTYVPPDPPGYFDLIVWPESRRSRALTLEKNKDLILLSGKVPISENLNEIIIRLEPYNFKRLKTKVLCE